jgi:hypothetical protein
LATLIPFSRQWPADGVCRPDFTVFKSSYGYHIIRFGGKRIAPFDEVEDRIYGLLSGRNRRDQFKKWVFDRRRRSEIRI